MKILKPKESLNKAYCRQAIKSVDYHRFISALCSLLDNVNNRQDEEMQKGHFSDFLKSAFYSNYIVGPAENNIDLAIRLSNSPTAPLGVIFEIKSTTNSREMVTRSDLKRKAMCEILLYYFKEREHGNTDIKYLVITNLKEFFMFDAQIIEKLFYENKKFRREYRDFIDKRKVKESTEIFYNEIAPKYIEDVEDVIEFTYFDMSDYKYDLKHNETSRKLSELFRLFSPIHLLKLPFGNDSNSLDKNFYDELLYILGLQEYKENNKTLIGRITDKPQPASLIENTINIIKAESSLPSSIKGDTMEDRYFNAAMQLIITWINRILFLKLLESQLINYHKGDNKYRFLNYSLINDFDTLNKLFFQVLGVPVAERTILVKDQFPLVPYLNSSLFEISRCEQDIIRISNLSQSECLPLFSRSILRKDKTYSSRKTLPFLEYLFAFLDAYDFSSEGRDEIKEQSKTLINASVLGLIFEKINGYKDGSVFTPGFITSYMCRESITRAVVDKYNDYYDWKLASYDELLNKDLPDASEANRIINTIRICDPAVGSGHFLVSALNEIVHIKYELGLLFDVNGKRLKKNEYTIAVENDELIILDCDGELWSYNPNNEESRRVQQAIFNEKKAIIENCLFGVDINPNSVNICRLRLWIELLKNAYYTSESGYTQLETLPNIDINIKCGNSLLNKFALDESIKFKEVSDYKKLVYNYKLSANKSDKHFLTEKINEIKNNLVHHVTLRNPITDKYQKAKGEYESLKLANLFPDDSLTTDQKRELKIRFNKAERSYKKALSDYEEYKKSSEYKGGFEWRIEFPEVLDANGNFEGFDIVLGNPPYGILNKKQNKGESIVVPDTILDKYKNAPEYAPAKGGMLNIYRLFILKSISLLKPHGLFCEIFPLAFTGDISASKTRKFIFDNCTVLDIEAFPERDNPAKRVFKTVKMSVCIVLLKKGKNDVPFKLRVNRKPFVETSKSYSLMSLKDICAFDKTNYTIPLTDEKTTSLLLKIFQSSKPLSAYAKCLTGEVDMTFCKGSFSEDTTLTPLVRGANIGWFHYNSVTSQGENIYIDKIKLSKIKCVSADLIDNPRIVMQGITGVNEKDRLKMFIVQNSYCSNSTNYLNIYEKRIPLIRLIGILNSKLLNFVFSQFSTNSNVNGYEVDNLPIKIPSKHIEEYVLELLKDYQNKQAAYKLNYYVYHLYNLTYDEVLIIDPDTPFSRDEYDNYTNEI